MKRISILMACLAALALAFSCTASPERLISDFQKFIDRTEQEMDNFTEEDWTRAEEDFDALIRKYKEQAENLTEEQKKAIDKAIGEYWGMIARHSSENFLDKAKKALESAPDKIEGFIEGLIDGAATVESDTTAKEPEGQSI